jgi:hypothetical protein
MITHFVLGSHQDCGTLRTVFVDSGRLELIKPKVHVLGFGFRSLGFSVYA